MPTPKEADHENMMESEHQCLKYLLLNIVVMFIKKSISKKIRPQSSTVTLMYLDVPAGGYNREECLRTVECYDPKEDRWTFIAPMRTPRARFQMAVLMVQFTISVSKFC